MPTRPEVLGIIQYYNDVTHTGIRTTIHAIRSKYNWIGSYQDVEEYASRMDVVICIYKFVLCQIKACHSCQMNAPLLPQPQRELHPISPPEELWAHCGIDLVCELPTNSKGTRHILFVVCYLTKYVAARALMNKTTR